eukprot:10810427-Ditylum_brightwellii.AAC.1
MVSQCFAKAVDTGLVPVEEAVECVVPQASNCVCLPSRCKIGGCGHPCVICNSLGGEEEGGLFHGRARQDQQCAYASPVKKEGLTWMHLGTDMEYLPAFNIAEGV